MKKILLAVVLLIAASVFTVGVCLYQQDNNSFFFPNAGSHVYNARFSEFSERSDQEIELQVTKTGNIENNVVYHLTWNADQQIQDRYGTDRMDLGYFFVTEDKIYLIHEDILSEEALTKEEMISMGTLVCREEEEKDALAPEEPGWHERIEADGNIRKYYGYNTLTETGYYEQFVWEKGIGLIKYKSGYGAEADDMEVDLVK